MQRVSPQAGDEPPEFFSDRSLMKRCPAVLRELGWRVTSWWDLYPDEEQNAVEDEVWIPHVVANRFCILSQDDAMRRSRIICDAIINNEAQIVALSRADLTGQQKAERFHAVQGEIYRRATVPGYAYFTLGGDLRLRRRNLA